MNKKYKKYIDYIVNDIELPYLKYLGQYGLKQDEMEYVLSKVFNEPVSIKGDYVYVYDTNGNVIYYENSYGYWVKRDYNSNGNVIYYEDGNGYWYKREYDSNGKVIYHEGFDGIIIDDR